MQTEDCMPVSMNSFATLGNASECKCDVYVLGYKRKCTNSRLYGSHIRHISVSETFKKTNTWTNGKKLLNEESIKVGRQYMYYIFIDDNVRLEVYRGNTMRNGWRVFEQFLLDHRPPIGLVDTPNLLHINHIVEMREKFGCSKHSVLENNVPTMYWDALVYAFDQDAVKNVLGPIAHVWNKFDNISWWYSNWYVCVMSDIVYHHSNVYSSELISKNLKHRNYPRKRWESKIVTHIFDNIETLIPQEFKAKGETLLNHWRTADLDKKRQNGYTFCVDPPNSCVKPYSY